jgi:hypothetical protein
MNILQDILGLITKGKVKPPTDKDYMVVASYTDAQEILKPQPKMQANLVSIGALKKFIQSSAGTTPTLQEVTDEGNTTTNDITVNSIKLTNGVIKSNGDLLITDLLDNPLISLPVPSFTYEIAGFTLTASRNYILPDASGTIALTTDIPTPTYKVYTALLTQSGGDNELFIEDFLTVGTQNIIKGVSYYIDVNAENVDFSSIGAPSNAEGTNFIATADKLNSDFPDVTWALRYNTGAPVATVLENTIGNIYFQYASPGLYACKSLSLFTEDKTTIDMDAYCQNGNPAANLIYRDLDTSIFIIGTYKSEFNDGYLSNNRLEIKVYN